MQRCWWGFSFLECDVVSLGSNYLSLEDEWKTIFRNVGNHTGHSVNSKKTWILGSTFLIVVEKQPNDIPVQPAD